MLTGFGNGANTSFWVMNEWMYEFAAEILNTEDPPLVNSMSYGFGLFFFFSFSFFLSFSFFFLKVHLFLDGMKINNAVLMECAPRVKLMKITLIELTLNSKSWEPWFVLCLFFRFLFLFFFNGKKN